MCDYAHAADLNCLKVPEGMSDKKVVLLSDVLPTAWHATELGGVSKGDRVAIWGAGPGTLSIPEFTISSGLSCGLGS